MTPGDSYTIKRKLIHRRVGDDDELSLVWKRRPSEFRKYSIIISSVRLRDTDCAMPWPRMRPSRNRNLARWRVLAFMPSYRPAARARLQQNLLGGAAIIVGHSLSNVIPGLHVDDETGTPPGGLSCGSVDHYDEAYSWFLRGTVAGAVDHIMIAVLDGRVFIRLHRGIGFGLAERICARWWITARTAFAARRQ